MAHPQAVNVEIEHGEIAYCPLRLSSLRSQDYTAGIGCQSDEMELFVSDGHAKRLTTILPFYHFRRVRVVDPIYVGRQIDPDGLSVGHLLHVVHGILKGGKHIGRHLLAAVDVPIHQDTMLVEGNGLSVIAK